MLSSGPAEYAGAATPGLDSEQFRFTPRTGPPAQGTLTRRRKPMKRRSSSRSCAAQRLLLATARKKSSPEATVAEKKELSETLWRSHEKFTSTPQAKTIATQLDAAGISPRYID